MMKHGRMKPTRKINDLGDFPNFLRMVQEKVSGA